jgi:TonB family protein
MTHQMPRAFPAVACLAMIAIVAASTADQDVTVPASTQNQEQVPAHVLNMQVLVTICTTMYPKEDQRPGVDGTVGLALRIDTFGRIADVRVEHSSGRQELDDAAVDCVPQFAQVAPATVDGQPVESWLPLDLAWISRRPQQAPAELSSDPLLPAFLAKLSPEESEAFASSKVYTAANTKCDSTRYPTALRAEGVEGTAIVAIRVDARGRATEARILKSSGSTALDEVAAGCFIQEGRFRTSSHTGQSGVGWLKFSWQWKLT